MEISISAEKVFEIGGFAVTNSMLASLFVAIILGIICYLGTKNMKKIPAGLQNILEIIVESLHNLTKSILQKDSLVKKIFPLIATLFIFIIANNWVGLLPGFGSIGVYEIHEGHKILVPLLRSGAADLNTTLALAIISFFTIQFVGIGVIGLKHYGKKFFNFGSPILFFVGILELISEFVKIISFSFRLFGNVFAGEVLLLVVATLVPFIVPMPFYAMEIFVGFIQALVFTMLSLVFIKMATISHDSEAHAN